MFDFSVSQVREIKTREIVIFRPIYYIRIITIFTSVMKILRDVKDLFNNRAIIITYKI